MMIQVATESKAYLTRLFFFFFPAKRETVYDLPPPTSRPWKLASKTLDQDQCSGQGLWVLSYMDVGS